MLFSFNFFCASNAISTSEPEAIKVILLFCAVAFTTYAPSSHLLSFVNDGFTYGNFCLDKTIALGVFFAFQSNLPTL